MAFTPTAAELMAEIQESERIRDDHLHGVNQVIREYTGRWYRGIRDSNNTVYDSEMNPEPFSYSFVSNMLPALVFENPSAICKARRVIGHRIVAQAMQSGIRAWINDINLKGVLEKVVLDFLFFQGILMHYIEDDQRWSDGAVRPSVARIDFRHWGCDSLAESIEDAAFHFHDYMVDLDDLMADPDIDPEALTKLQAAQNEDINDKDAFKKGEAAKLKRKRVRIYSVWCRENSTLRVLTKSPEAIEIYPERPYYGPRTGPYTVFRAYPVPGHPYPLSPLLAVRDQVADLQLHAKATARAAAARKSIVIVDGTVSNLGEDVKNSEDHEVLSVNGFNSSQAQQFEFGGVTNQQYQWLDTLRARLDRHSGLTETVRGQVSGGTATESQIASEALNNRTEYLKGQVRKATSHALKSVGWFLFHTPGIIIPVNGKDPLTGMETEALFFGGQFPGEDSGSWDDYDIQIEPLSMERVSESLLQSRALQFANFISSTAPLMPQMPWVKWDELIRMVGDSINQDNPEGFIVWEMLGMFSQPDMMPPSSASGKEQPADRYSVPGQGFKPRPPSDQSNASPSVDDRRAELSKPFGDTYGGTQGPPGSRNPYG